MFPKSFNLAVVVSQRESFENFGPYRNERKNNLHFFSQKRLKIRGLVCISRFKVDLNMRSGSWSAVSWSEDGYKDDNNDNNDNDDANDIDGVGDGDGDSALGP